MAKWCFVLETLILYLCINTQLNTALGQSDYYRYEINDLNSEESLIFILFDDAYGFRHDITKRDVSNSTVTISNSTGTTNITEKPVLAVHPPKKMTSVTLQKSVSNVSVPLLQKNLGENGTGIAKYNFTTKAPPLIHDIKPSTSENTTSVFTKKLKVNNDHHDEHNDDPFSIDNVDEDDKAINETLNNHNVTETKMDHNLFYNTSVISDINISHFYWVNMTNRSDVKVNDLLSQSHRRAATVKLSFDFPFYGHLIKNVTIATGGFLYTGDYVHSWLAATQYIAPLMANFDTSLSNDSFIKYVDNGTAFTVEWEKVTLQDKPEDGEFSFQVTLFKNGDIAFVYQTIPLSVDQIQEHNHPVKVGLSDAYITDQLVYLVRRKTIYEYDRVNLNKSHIKNWTIIYLKALPTCLDAHDCELCLTRKLPFECFWCPAMKKCSQGFDRERQNWLAHGCDKTSFSNQSMCSVVTYQTDDLSDYSNVYNPNTIEDKPTALAGKIIDSKGDSGFSGILAVLFLVGMVSGLTIWVFYAYRNPHTTSGQILIRYRPSQWRWRRGEARYTAATIHM